MLKCYIYSNCFGKVLQQYLSIIPEFTSVYDIKVFYIMDDPREVVDLNYLKNTDLFIYQHMKKNAFKECNGEFYCTDSIKKLLSSYCKVISIPSCYFDGYFIDGLSQENLPTYLKQTKDKQGKLLCDYFPNYSFNKKLFNMLSSKMSIEVILKNIQSNDFYTKSEIYNYVNSSFNRFSQKETSNNTDIPLTDFILENYRKKRLFNTTNHPSKYIFRYVIEELFKKLNFNIQVSENMYDIDIMKYTGRNPIFNCIINYLDMPIDFNNQFYIQDSLFKTLYDYIDFYKKLFDDNNIDQIL